MSVLSLNDDLARQKKAGRIVTDAPQLNAWRAWRDNWAKWYGDTDANTWLWGATGETLDSYAGALNKWRDWYLRAFGSAPSMVPQATNPDDAQGRGVPGVLIAIGAVAATLLIVKIVR